MALALLAAATLPTASAVTFQDIAANGSSGLAYGRTPSARFAIQQAFVADSLIDVLNEYLFSPIRTYGAPGVAVLDYDGDGDSDIYATNGPGTPNSLFRNLLRETGQVQFQDVAQAAGAALAAQDSQGVCYGDIDNDRDLDLFETGYKDNRLLQNQGDGTFAGITAAAGAGGEGKVSTSCAMGDVNGDGLLDVLVANAFDFASIVAFWQPWIHHQHNQLLINAGGNVFSDQSEASGLRNLAGLAVPGSALNSWAASLIDINMTATSTRSSPRISMSLNPTTPAFPGSSRTTAPATSRTRRWTSASTASATGTAWRSAISTAMAGSTCSSPISATTASFQASIRPGPGHRAGSWDRATAPSQILASARS